MVPLSELSELTIPLHTALTLVFYLVVAGYTIFTFIMYYHWNEYSLDNKVSRITLLFYFLTTLPLVICMGLITFFIL